MSSNFESLWIYANAKSKNRTCLQTTAQVSSMQVWRSLMLERLLSRVTAGEAAVPGVSSPGAVREAALTALAALTAQSSGVSGTQTTSRTAQAKLPCGSWQLFLFFLSFFSLVSCRYQLYTTPPSYFFDLSSSKALFFFVKLHSEVESDSVIVPRLHHTRERSVNVSPLPSHLFLFSVTSALFLLEHKGRAWERH